MSTQDIILIIGAIVAGLGTLGAGIKWLVSTIIASQEKVTTAFTTATTAFTSSSEKLGHAITESSAAQVAAVNSMRLELREQRVEIRTLIGLRPPEETEPSEDGEPAPLTPLRGVPVSPPTLPHMIVHRKGKP